MMFGCSVAGRLQRQQMTASLSQLTRAERQERQQDYRPQVVKLQRDSNTFFLAKLFDIYPFQWFCMICLAVQAPYCVYFFFIRFPKFSIYTWSFLSSVANHSFNSQSLRVK